jgi:hypothetical protein
MKVYHGERTEHGCIVTVDGKQLRPCSDLSGNATTAFDWEYVGGGQLALALLHDLLGDDRRAKALYPAFEEKVVAELPNDHWTLTEADLTAAVDGVRRSDGASNETRATKTVGDIPVLTACLVPGGAALTGTSPEQATAGMPGLA